MRALSLLGLFLLALSEAAHSDCECLWQGSFTDVEGATDLVISGTVLASKGNSIDLEPQRLLRGDLPIGTLRIWLKAADYCRPETQLFPVGSQWVMALHRINNDVPGGFNPHTPNVSYGRIGDYSLSSCGGYWLSQKGSVVTGNLVNAPRWVRDPQMTPVLLDLVADFVAGEIDEEAIKQASREDPALRELMLDTRSFLRKEN